MQTSGNRLVMATRECVHGQETGLSVKRATQIHHANNKLTKHAWRGGASHTWPAFANAGRKDFYHGAPIAQYCAPLACPGQHARILFRLVILSAYVLSHMCYHIRAIQYGVSCTIGLAQFRLHRRTYMAHGPV